MRTDISRLQAELSKTEAPIFDALNETIFVISATINVHCLTPDSTIFYTTDGSVPTESSMMTGPSDPIILTEPANYIIHAIATSPTLEPSPLVSLTVSVVSRVSTPTFAVIPKASQTYINSVTIIIRCSTPNATIWYTTDGSSPVAAEDWSEKTNSGTPIEWSHTGKTIFRARASAPGMADSAIAQESYTVILPPFELMEAPSTMDTDEQSSLKVRSFLVSIDGQNAGTTASQTVRGKLALLSHPVGRFKVLAPKNGCGEGSLELASSIRNSFLTKEGNVLDSCEVVVPAGFFDPVAGTCSGNLVSQGNVIQASPASNTNFGIRNGAFVIGNLNEEEVTSVSLPFQELVTGLGWLVRKGASYITESLGSSDLSPMDLMLGTFENKDARLQAFSSSSVHRSAIGVDEKGHLMLVTVDGGDLDGCSLENFAQALIKLGVYHAVNLVGHSFASMSVNGTVATTLSSVCSDTFAQAGLQYFCERPVSSVICFSSNAQSTKPDMTILETVAPLQNLTSSTTIVATNTPAPISTKVVPTNTKKPATKPAKANHPDQMGNIASSHAGPISPLVQHYSSANFSTNTSQFSLEQMCVDYATVNENLKMAVAVLFIAGILSLAGNVHHYLYKNIAGPSAGPSYIRHHDLRGFSRVGTEDDVELRLYGGEGDNSRHKKSKTTGRRLKNLLNTVQGKMTGEDGMREIDMEINPFESTACL